VKAKELAEMLMRHPEAEVYLYDDAIPDPERTHTKAATGTDSAALGAWVIVR
jgi:hypothetical protein